MFCRKTAEPQKTLPDKRATAVQILQRCLLLQTARTMCGQQQSSHTPNSRAARRDCKNGYSHHAHWTLCVAAIKTKKKQGHYAGEQPSAAEPQ